MDIQAWQAWDFLAPEGLRTQGGRGIRGAFQGVAGAARQRKRSHPEEDPY